MARAKRTAKAEARRRFRESQRAEEGAIAEATSVPVTPESPRRSGFLRLPNFREDLRALPQIALRTPALWAPGLAMAVAFVIGLADPAVLQTPAAGQALPFQETAVRFYFQFVLFPPAMGVVFLAGLLAPRAQWLVGGIVGTVGAVLFYILGIVHTTTPIDPAAIAVPILAAITFSAWFGALLGALAGWYRRWLRQTAERNRARAEERRKTQAREARQQARPGTGPAATRR